jgi:hypothetical protein
MRPSRLVAAVLLLLLASTSPASVPGLINYQSRLLQDGTPAEGVYTVTFRIFDHPTSSTGGPCGSPGARCVWEETQGGIVVTKGVFNVLLGAVNPLDESVFAGPDRWIEIQVAGQVMTPRQRIASAAYALKSSPPVQTSVVVAAANSARKETADFVAPGAADQQTIQDAIDSIGVAGGEVLLLAGTYVTSGTIFVPTSVRVVGQGPATEIKADPGWNPPDTPQTAMLATYGGARRTEIAHLRLTSNGDPGLFGWHGINGSYNNWIHHNYFRGFRSLAGTVDPSGSNRNIVSENIFYDCSVGYNGTDTNAQFGNVVANNSFFDCGVWCIKAAWPFELTVVGNSMSSTIPGAVGIRIDGTYGDIANGETERGRIVIANNVIRMTGASPNGHGMHLGVAGSAERALYGDFEKVSITGNYISTEQADAVVFHSTSDRIHFRGNTVDTIANDGSVAAVSAIRIGAAYDAKGAASTNIDIAGNAFYGGPAGTALELDHLGHTGITFRDNRVHGYGTGVEIHAAGAGSAAHGTRITDNIFTDVAEPVVDHGTATVIRDNVGHPTEGSGSATVPAGATSVEVAHGLAVPPSIHDVSVTPTNGLGSATRFWIADVTPTHFTIHVDADPGKATAAFVWQIRRHD